MVGGFSTVNGRFTAPELSGDKYFEAKGIPKHRDECQMGHYFDFSAWQDDEDANIPGRVDAVVQTTAFMGVIFAVSEDEEGDGDEEEDEDEIDAPQETA